MIFRKKKTEFGKIVKSNYESDAGEKLKEGLKNLLLRCNEINKKAYMSGLLLLFNKEGSGISLKESDMLLLLRKKTNQILFVESG